MEGTQEEMKSLGVFGIYKEGHKVMAPYRKIFIQIALAFMLPVAFIYLAEMEVSEILFPRQRYNFYGGRYSNTLKDWTVYTLFKLAYYTSLLIFSLLSTSSVVYSIACIYANRTISFTKVIAVVPKVWKRLMLTFIVTYAFTFIYLVVVIVTMYLCLANYSGGTTTAVLVYGLLILYIIGIVYLTIVWQLASIITVLEDFSGIKAMKKSRNLIKDSWAIWKRVLVGISCLVLLVPIFLYQLVLQTIIYFVCKSYHNETIDKPAMSNHLGAYERLYGPSELQMEQV
ncbi:uncharacterized protein LOC141720360 isoform X2 [Apium graveolens]|uniref:uncharacterized protein LOC141720360 isoform X2 n=1 Tax=Apium graveolens TaxID=4045 RepID=UPI003D79865C